MGPSTPTSLVNPAARLSAVSTGAVSSTPASDHVPQETYPNSSSAAGTAKTADAVSCEPTAVTGSDGGSPAGAATSARSEPAGEPGGRSGGNRKRGRPSRASSGSDHAPDRTSYRPVVEAFVTSAPTVPVSQYASRAGIISSVRAWAGGGADSGW